MSFTNSRITNAAGEYHNVLVLREGSETVKRFAEQVHVISRPGLIGSDFALPGAKARPFRVQVARDCVNDSEGRQLADWFDDLQGSLISYVDEHAHQWTEVMVLESVSELRLAPNTGFYYRIYDPLDPDTAAYLVFCGLRLQLTVEPATE